MDIAVISPIKHLKDFSVKGDFDFCLAHVALRSKEYIKYFRDQSQAGRFVLVDNGVFELEKAVGIEDMLKVAKQVKASEVVAPDVLKDWHKTVRSVSRFLDVLVEKNLVGKFQVQAVVQGKTFWDWLACYEELAAFDEVDTLGIPFDMSFFDMDKSSTRNMWLNRVFVMRYLVERGLISLKPHHLLGLSDPIELRSQALIRQIRSNDSSSAVVHGASTIVVSGYGLCREKIVEKLDFDGTIPKSVHSYISENIAVLKKFAHKTYY